MSIYPLIARPMLPYAPSVFGGASAYQPQYPPTGGTLEHYEHAYKKRKIEKRRVYKSSRKSTDKRMPNLYKRRRTYRKRRPTTFKRRKTMIPYQVVPKSRLVKMRLCERVLLTGTTGATGVANTYYNSLQDPLVAVGTGQPYYYDQIKTMYRTGIVVGAKYNVTFHNTSSTVPAVVGLYLIPWDNSTGINSYEYFREVNAKGRQRVLSSDVDTCHLVLKVSTRKHLGVSKIKDNDDLKCDIENDGDPTRLGTVTILSQAVDQTSTSTVEAIITIEQVVLLMHPYQPARSVDS